MLVFRSEERVTEATSTSVVEQHEVLCLGVAVASDFVLGMRSQLLQGVIRDVLQAAGLVA